MEREPLMTLTYLPTVEDYKSFVQLEQRTLSHPGMFEDAKTRKTAKYVIYALVIVSAVVYFLTEGIIKNFGLLCFCMMILFSIACGPSYQWLNSGKLNKEFTQSKSRSASLNIFIYEDRLELRSVYEEIKYPWTLLTDWKTDGNFILCFSNDIICRIPARAINQSQRAELENLLVRKIEMNEGK